MEVLSYFSWIGDYMASIDIHWKGLFVIYFYYIYFHICMYERENQTLMWKSEFILSSIMSVWDLISICQRAFMGGEAFCLPEYDFCILLHDWWFLHTNMILLMRITCGIIFILMWLYHMSHVRCHFTYSDPITAILT